MAVRLFGMGIKILTRGEESGLNGSRAFVDDPIWPLSDVSLMTNFDMIGRAIDGKVQVAGAETGVGLRAIIEAAVEDCPLEVTLPSRSPGASDHTSFEPRNSCIVRDHGELP